MKKKLEPHSWTGNKVLSRQVCRKCGLVALKNDFTAWCIQMGCDYRDHPEYEAKRMQYTRLPA